MISEALERLSGKAIQSLENILDVPLPEPDHETFPVIVKAHNAAAATSLATQTKVDENALKKRGQDMVPEIVELIRKYDQENPTRILRVVQGGRAGEPSQKP